MRSEVVNKNRNCVFNGPYAGRDLYIAMFQDSEREFIVTHNANIKPVAYFTGRETELQELRRKVEEGRKSVLVSGMGGVGKTQICRKLFGIYLDMHGKNKDMPFRHIGYIEYNGNIGASLQNCLKFKRQDNPEQDLEAAWRELEYLAADGKLLLFVDNVNVTIGEDTGLGRLKQIPGAVVLTSRRTSFSKEFEPYSVGFLSTEQCKAVYEKIRYTDKDNNKKVPDEEEPDLVYIIEKLAARHTITIELLAHLAKTKNWKTIILRKELESKGFCLKYKDEYNENKIINIQEEYEKLYDLSTLNEAEQNILEAFSLFPYIPLEAEVCNQWVLSDAGVSEDDDVLIGLYRKGWLQFDIDEESYTLHPVFAQFIYEKCKPKTEGHSGLIKACQRKLQFPERGSALKSRKYIAFAENMIEKLDMTADIKNICFVSDTAYLLFYVAAEYAKSAKLCKKSLEICEKVLGEQHPNTAANYNNLAMIYESQGKYVEAEELYKKGLEIRKKVLGMQHPETASSYNNLAVLYVNQGKYAEAEKLYEKSLGIRERVLGEQHPETAFSYSNLAEVYVRQGKYAEAEGLCKKSLEIRKKVLGEQHLETASSYSNLALMYIWQRKYVEAEELCKKSLEIRKRVLGERHPEVAYIYANLAGMYVKQEKYAEAEGLYKKSQEIFEKVLGEQCQSAADSYNNLAVVYVRQRKYAEAEKLYKKSLEIRKKILGEQHPDIASSYYNLAGVYVERRKYAEAEKLYKKSLEIRKKVLGEQHMETADSYCDLAGAYARQGKYTEAEGLYKKSLTIRKKVLGEQHPETAFSYNNLAMVYRCKQEYKIAVSYFWNAYKILAHVFGLNHPDTKRVGKNIKEAYYKWYPQGDFEGWLEEEMRK